MNDTSHRNPKSKIQNLKSLSTLSEQERNFLRKAAELAADKSWRIYLEGGYVRDLFLQRPHYDLDISVEGDAVALAQELQSHFDAHLETATRFGTVYMEFAGDEHKHKLDLVTARKERYDAPGALPTVEPGTIQDDLARRDFTINAMAIALTPEGLAGTLLDPHGGLNDLQAGLVRVLHPNSFNDDPTRIPRAVKYALRLGFKIEPETLELILLAVRDGALATVSMDRIMREILLIMEERRGGAMLAKLKDLGALRAVHPYLAWPYPANSPIHPPENADFHAHERRNAYLAILAAEFADDPTDAESLARTLGLGAHLTRLMRDAAQLAHVWPQFGQNDLAPSQIYSLLKGLDLAALQAYSRLEAMSADSVAWGRLQDYLQRLRHIKTALDGNYLRELGLPPGPVYSRLLDALLEAKLDGKTPKRKDEERFVKEWLNREGLNY